MKRSALARISIGATTLVAAAGMAVVTGLSGATANAADPGVSEQGTVKYDVTGSSHIANKNANFTVPLGPTNLLAELYTKTDDSALYFRAALPLPAKQVFFKAFGYLPVRATVSFVQVGQTTGKLDNDGENGTRLDATARYTVKLSNVIIGYTRANVGNKCQTQQPIAADVSSGNNFQLDGGDLTASYTLGKFVNCGTSTELTNLIVPGPDNTIKLTVGNLSFLDATTTPTEKQARAQIDALAK